MQYRKYRISWNIHPDRLYRTCYIRTDLTLDIVSEIIQDMFCAAHRHDSSFLTDSTRYAAPKELNERNKGYPIPFLGVSNTDLENAWPNVVLMNRFRLSDLGSRFTFVYDYRECWIFRCEASDEAIEHNSQDGVIMTDGKGYGLFEDDIMTLWEYADGEVDPEMDSNDNDNEHYMPWNLALEKIGDFDRPLNLKEENEIANRIFHDDSVIYGRKLYNAVRTYSAWNSEENRQKAIDVLQSIIDKNLYLPVAGRWLAGAEMMQPEGYRAENDRIYVIVFSTDLAAQAYEHAQTFRYNCADFLQLCLGFNDTDGIIIDPDTEGHGLIIPSYIIRNIFETLNMAVYYQ